MGSDDADSGESAVTERDARASAAMGTVQSSIKRGSNKPKTRRNGGQKRRNLVAGPDQVNRKRRIFEKISPLRLSEYFVGTELSA